MLVKVEVLKPISYIAVVMGVTQQVQHAAGETVDLPEDVVNRFPEGVLRRIEEEPQED